MEFALEPLQEKITHIHPNKFIRVATPLYKRRGKLTATVRSDWVERLFVLTDTALYWYRLSEDLGGGLLKIGPQALGSEQLGTQQGRVDVRHVVSIKQVELHGDHYGRTPEELQKLGPRYQLEIATVLPEPASHHVLGCNNKLELDEWHAALSRTLSALVSPLTPTPTPPTDGLLRLDLLGVLALGSMQKAREQLLKNVLGQGGWSTRFLVLTPEYLYFFKDTNTPKKAQQEDAPFLALGSSLRSGEFVFGQERGRMSLANAECASESVREEGKAYTQLTLTGALSGLSQDSLMQKGLSKLSKVSEMGVARFKAVLRTDNAAEAAEWCAVLRFACGAQRQQGYARLQAAITDGDVSTAASMAQELARIAAVVPSLQRPDRGISASLGLASGLGLPRPGSPHSPKGDSPKAVRESHLSRSAPTGTASPHQVPGFQPLMGGAWMGEERLDGGLVSPRSPTGQSMCSSDDEGGGPAPGHSIRAELPNAAAARGSRLAGLQAENDALKRRLATQEGQLRGALLKGESMQLALRRIAEAAAISAGDRPRSPSDEMVLTGGPPPSLDAALAAPVSTSPVLLRLDTDTRTSVIVERLEAEGQHLQAAELMAAKLESMAHGQAKTRSVAAFAAGATTFGAAGVIAVEDVRIADDSDDEDETKRSPVVPARGEGGEGVSPMQPSSGDESPPHELAAEVEVKLETPSTPPSPSSSSAPPATPPAPAAPPSALTRPPAKGEAGYTLSGSAHAGFELCNGDGTSFDVRIGPNYKKTGKKAPSLDAPYVVATADLLRRPKALYDVAQQIKLPPPPDPDVANDTGLPRRLVLNLILPNEQPSLTSAKTDGECVQLIVVFTASTAQLRAWQQSDMPAARLYTKWIAGWAESTELKERLKLLSKVENITDLGSAFGFASKYNGKPALITKSGQIAQGEDYIEMGINTFRFAFLTKKGVNMSLPRSNEMVLQAGVTIEGREDDELPEQMIAVAYVKHLDLTQGSTDI